jgi:phosphoribosyl 1,2-cyclic phosphate phosphodiesterase
LAAIAEEAGVQIEFLGSGGAIPTPRPGCACRICTEARERGVPYSRGGPSVFVHGPDLLIDTPEDIRQELNRSRVAHVPACLYSHWHPDHVAGLRIFESLNLDLWRWPHQHRCTDVYLPRQVAADFQRQHGYWEQLTYLQQLGVVRVIVLNDGDALGFGDVQVRQLRLAETYVYAFLFEGDGKRVLVAPDELRGWQPPAGLGTLDLAVLPMGIAEFDPFTGERRIDERHPVLKSEATFDQTLAIVRGLGARRVILTHIEEPDGLSYDDLARLEARLRREGLDVSFAYDTLLVDV